MNAAAIICNVLAILAIAEALLHLPRLGLPSGVRPIVCLAWTVLLLALAADGIGFALGGTTATAGGLFLRAALAGALLIGLISAAMFSRREVLHGRYERYGPEKQRGRDPGTLPAFFGKGAA